jgi:hypothetical protein
MLWPCPQVAGRKTRAAAFCRYQLQLTPRKPMSFVNLTRTIIFLAVFIFGSSASAAVYKARISSILFYEGGDLIYIYVEGGTKDRPSCAGSNGDYISFSMKRPRAKEYLSGLMLAYASGKPVLFTTAGACVDQSVSDTLVYFAIENG